MKKKYVFLAVTLGNMGGIQMFISNKVAFLEKNGWEVYVFYSNHNGEILIDNLKKYKDNYCPVLSQNIAGINKSIIESSISQISDGVGLADRIIVETLLVPMTYWGELLAKKMKGQHIVDFLEEEFKNPTKRQASFYEFKLKRWECLNASDTALRKWFGDKYKEEYREYQNEMVPICSNVIGDSSTIVESFPKVDFNILCVGRLRKPYILPMFNEVSKFIKVHTEKTFNIIIVGGSPDGSVESKINELLRPFPNINVYQLGYLYPIPANLIDIADVGISSSNSVFTTAERGIPTISVDGADFDAIGVYGHTTTNTLFRTTEPKIKISILLDDILIKNKYPRKSIEFNSNNVYEALKPQIDFLSRSTDDGVYYDISKTYSCLDVLIAKLKRIWIYLLRVKNEYDRKKIH